jgi:hypothetical protein
VHAEPLGLRGAQVGNLCIKENFLETEYVRNGEEIKAPRKVYEDRFRKR